MLSQNRRVLEYLREFGSITPLQAFQDIGCLRLASRVHELKQEGHAISASTIEGRNRWGQPIHYAQYKLARGAEQTQMAI